MKRGFEREAESILTRVAGAEEARRETDQIRASLHEEAGVTYRDLAKPGLRWALFLAVCLAVLQQVTGINTVLYYGSIIFKEMAGEANTADAIGFNIAIGANNFLCTIVALFTIDRLGRRFLLIAGSSGMAVSLLALGLAFRMQPLPTSLIKGLILTYVACFALSLGPGVWVYISEIFPTAIRGRAMSIATLSLWLACSLVTFTFLTLANALTPAGAFWLYGILCVVTAVFVWKWVPETKGRTLEEIQLLFKRR